MDHDVRQDVAWPSHCAPGKMTMSKFKFHKLAAIVVLIVFAGWVATGAFSSVGSDAPPENANAAEKPKAEPAPNCTFFGGVQRGVNRFAGQSRRVARSEQHA